MKLLNKHPVRTIHVAVPKTAVLLAVTPPSVERMRRLLSGHEVVLAESLQDVASVIRGQKFGLVVVAVHFDESRMFDVVQHVRMNAVEKTVPIACIYSGLGGLSDVAIAGLDHAVKALTANAFLDLRKFSDDEAGDARVRRILDYLILIDGDMHQGLGEV